MANVTITQLPAADTLTGSELVPVVQNGVTVRTTTADIAASPSLTQTFLTLNNEPSLANSRYLSVGTGLGLTDNGAQSNLVLNLNGASGSLEAAGNGFISKTNSATVVARSLTTSGNGLTVTNGNGASGNPTFALTGLPEALANLSGGGLLVSVDPSTVLQRSITGVSNEISVNNGTGVSDNPEIGIADNPVLPGTGAVQVPGGTTAQRPTAVAGKLRFNSDSSFLEYYTGGMWANLSAGASIANNIGGGVANQILFQAGPSSTSFIVAPTVANTFLEWSGSTFQWSANPLGTVTSVDVSGGTTGLTTSGGPITTSGTITFAGTLITSNGGTGLSSYTAGDLVYWASGTAFNKLAIGTTNQVLASTGTAPNWVSNVTLGTITATTKVVSPVFDAAGSAGGQLRNATGTSQLAWGAGGGSNLSLEVATNINPANASVSISPTGSGSVTINPATAGTINNMAIGGTTAAAVTGTTITASTQFSGPGTGLTGTAAGLSIGGNAATATTATTATSATTATNVAGGGANQIVFNTGAGATSFAVAPTVANTYLEWSGSAFQWSANPLGTVTSVNVDGGTTGLTFSGGPITTSGTITMAGTLAIANGGTNATATPTAGAIAYGTGTAYAFSSAGTASQVLLSGGASTPTWSNQSSLSVGTATNATNTAITDDTTTNATMYPTWVTANTGNLPQKVTSTKLTFNPSSGVLTVTGGISGGTF